MKKILSLLIGLSVLSACSSPPIEETSITPEFTDNVRLTINDVFTFEIPQNWITNSIQLKSDEWLPLSYGPGTYKFDVYTDILDTEPDLITMEVNWLDAAPNNLVTGGSFYSDDDRFVLYRNYDCSDSFDECWYLEDLDTYYYSIDFTHEQVGDESVDLFWDLDWMETVQTPSGMPINEVAEYYWVEEKAIPEVMQYMLMLAEEDFLHASGQQLTDAIDVLDEENYYISLNPMWLDGNASFTIFIDPNGDYLLASETKGCGPMCMQSIHFYRINNDELLEVTDEILPDLDFESMATDFDPLNPLYELPRYSTTIRVYDQVTQTDLFELHWKNSAFTAEQVY